MLTSNFEIANLKNILKSTGLVVLRDMEASEEELLEFAESLSAAQGDRRAKLLHWEFGPVMTMRFDPQAANYLFSAEKVPFHWDGAFHREPRFLLFHCLESDGEGGETLFTNTERIFEDLRADEKELLSAVRLSFRTEKKAHYGGQIDIDLVQSHPEKGSKILRIAEEVETKLNPVSRLVHGAEDARALVERITTMLSSPRYCEVHRWKKNDLVIADNFSMVHGRNALGDNRVRAFRRIQIL